MRVFRYVVLVLAVLLLLSGCYSQSDVDNLEDEYNDKYSELEAKYDALYSKYENLLSNSGDLTNMSFSEACEKVYWLDRIYNWDYSDGDYKNFDDAMEYVISFISKHQGNANKALEACEYLYGYYYHIFDF